MTNNLRRFNQSPLATQEVLVKFNIKVGTYYSLQNCTKT